jgi:hypothetical protein
MTAMSDILLAVKAALTVSPTTTAAGANVFTPGDWPLQINSYPVILLSVQRERKASLGKNGPPQFKTTTTVRISARVAAPPAAADGGGSAAEVALWALARQIEIAVVNAPGLWQLVEQMSQAEAELAFSSDGAEHIAQINYDMDFQYYQGLEDFYQSELVALEEVDVQFPNYPTPSGQDVGIIIDLPQ